MGVEHGLFCHKCQTWVDGHKCWDLYFTVHERWDHKTAAYVTRPATVDECEGKGSGSWYWAQRMFAFLFNHKAHGAEVEWLNDGGEDQDRYYELHKKYREEWPPNGETTVQGVGKDE